MCLFLSLSPMRTFGSRVNIWYGINRCLLNRNKNVKCKYYTEDTKKLHNKNLCNKKLGFFGCGDFCCSVTFLHLHLSAGSPLPFVLQFFVVQIFVMQWPLCTYIYLEYPHHLWNFCCGNSPNTVNPPDQ